MLSSSDKLMSGEFEALERLQAELDLFDDPNRTEEIVEQMDVENHIDLIEEEVCSDTGDAITNEDLNSIKQEVIVLDDDNHETFDNFDKKDIEIQAIEQMKVESVDSEVVTLQQPLEHLQTEIVTISSSSGTKRSAPSISQENQQSKKSVRYNNIIILIIIITFSCFFSYLAQLWLIQLQVQVLEEILNKLY